jgi:hypothetical protein
VVLGIRTDERGSRRRDAGGVAGRGGCEALDGCWVEPDGTCPHGKPSWLLVLGYV